MSLLLHASGGILQFHVVKPWHVQVESMGLVLLFGRKKATSFNETLFSA